MRTLTSLTLSLTAFACSPPSQLEGLSLEVNQGLVEVGMWPTEEHTCTLLDGTITATVNGKRVPFTSRGGGGCHQTESSGANFFDWSSGPSKIWLCDCKPAVIEVGPEALDVQLCDGDFCATAAWPALPPFPALSVLGESGDDAPVTVAFTPDRGGFAVTITRGTRQLDNDELSWTPRTVVVEPHPDNKRGLKVGMRRWDMFSATRCVGFGACGFRTESVSSTRLLVP